MHSKQFKMDSSLELVSHLLFEKGQVQMNVSTEQTDQMRQVHNHFIFPALLLFRTTITLWRWFKKSSRNRLVEIRLSEPEITAGDRGFSDQISFFPTKCWNNRKFCPDTFWGKEKRSTTGYRAVSAQHSQGYKSGYLGYGQTSNFSRAEPNANEVKQRT